ncbi:hypothetical protein ECG_03686 [Echinococcus granulosus]|nr:hypothetical protein ECG_03692 [Echinococcus granulosus]KAH9283885.1 hypothetical protein ECG_03686 [Echinococcus granulosus]
MLRNGHTSTTYLLATRPARPLLNANSSHTIDRPLPLEAIPIQHIPELHNPHQYLQTPTITSATVNHLQSQYPNPPVTTHLTIRPTTNPTHPSPHRVQGLSNTTSHSIGNRKPTPSSTTDFTRANAGHHQPNLGQTGNPNVT